MAGYIAVVLHAHLPYVRKAHGECLEERWFFEAMTETYIPLVSMMQNLRRDQVPFKFTVSLSPTLLGMMQDSVLQQKFSDHLENSLRLAEKEIKRTQHSAEFNDTARMYKHALEQARDVYEQHDRQIIDAYRNLRDSGSIDVMTSAATHAYLPLLSTNPSSVRAQLAVAFDQFERVFGGRPSGVWLPECGFYRGLEEILAEFNTGYFVVEHHGLKAAEPEPLYGVYAPVRCPGGVTAFGRDPECAKQVWSATEGYPGDHEYREFYRDIGHELPLDYIGPYVHGGDFRVDTGFKYHKITGPTEHKEPYCRKCAERKARTHAENFVFNRGLQTEHLSRSMDRPPIVVAPYDAELFGHWWYEGPIWLEHVARVVASNQNGLSLVTPSEYLLKHPDTQNAVVATSSWGYKGFHEVWLNGSNDWMWPYIHWAGRRMRELCHKFGSEEKLNPALRQAARELLLAEASDWPFILNNKTAVNYAESRFKEHMQRFKYLHDALLAGNIDLGEVERMRTEDNLFGSIPLEAWLD